MNKLAGVGGLAALAVLVAGCSGSSSTKSADTPTVGGSSTVSSSSTGASTATSSGTSSGGSSGTSSATGTSPTAAKLAAVVLQQSDLPSGWKAAAHEDDPNDAVTQAALVACVGGTNTDKDKVANANSSDFSFEDASVSSSATSYKSKSDLAADTAIINSPKINTCYQQLAKEEISKSLPAGSAVTAVKISITPGANGGPSNVVGLGTGSITVTVSGKPVVVYLDVAFITGNLTEAEVDVERPSTAIPTAFFTSLVKAVATRAAAI